MNLAIDRRKTFSYRENFEEVSPYLNCLEPMLKVLGWKGHSRHLFEVLPHFHTRLELSDFKTALEELNFSCEVFHLSLKAVKEGVLPALFVAQDAPPMILIHKSDDHLNTFNRASCEYEEIPIPSAAVTGALYYFTPNDESLPSQHWFQSVLLQHRQFFLQLFAIGFFNNLLMIAPPLFTMAVYNIVIGADSPTSLVSLSFGFLIALLGIGLLQKQRHLLLAYLGTRLDLALGKGILKRILYLAPRYSDNASLTSQMARLRDFDSVRSFFTGPLLNIFLELPFTLIFITTIGFIAGPLCLIPLGLACVFTLAAALLHKQTHQFMIENAQASEARQGFILETLIHREAIQHCSTVAHWVERYKKLSGKASTAYLKSHLFTQISDIVSQGLTVIASVSMLGWGVCRVIDGQLSVGGLIASMMLIWRIVLPLKTIFVSIIRLDQVSSGIRQVNTLMQIAPERDPNRLIYPIPKFRGTVEFNRISFRHATDGDPILQGIHFHINPGEIIAITGPNGSGKSTLFKMLLGLYTPQMGTIRIDNIDIRQFDPCELRHAIAYVPQNTQLFYGTIAQNLRLANPIATEDDLKYAAAMAGLLNDILSLPNGFDTQIRDQSIALPTSFQQRLALARAYIKQSSILLLDEPVHALDQESDRLFCRALSNFRGNTTTLMVTHRPSHIKLADRVFVLYEGQIVLEDTPENALAKIERLSR